MALPGITVLVWIHIPSTHQNRKAIWLQIKGFSKWVCKGHQKQMELMFPLYCIQEWACALAGCQGNLLKPDRWKFLGDSVHCALLPCRLMRLLVQTFRPSAGWGRRCTVNEDFSSENSLFLVIFQGSGKRCVCRPIEWKVNNKNKKWAGCFNLSSIRLFPSPHRGAMSLCLSDTTVWRVCLKKSWYFQALTPLLCWPGNGRAESYEVWFSRSSAPEFNDINVVIWVLAQISFIILSGKMTP